MTTTSPTPGEPAELNALVALLQREHRAGRLAEAAEACRKILAIRPDIAEVHNDLGTMLQRLGKLDEAVAVYEQALALRPDFAQSHFNLGNILGQQGKFELAKARYRQAIALMPNYVEAHNNLGNLLWKQGQPEQAAAHFEQALAFRPNYAAAHNNLGNVLVGQGQLQQAAARFRQALALRPDLAETHKNLGNVLLSLGNIDEAADHFQRALALRPDHAEAHLGLAVCYLVEGDYERGWATHEGRPSMPKPAPPHSLPRWTGEPLAGRSLLLLSEQGLGDTLHFVRYARLLKEQGARVVLAAQPALGRLLAAYRDVDELLILGPTDKLPSLDFYLPLLSARYVLRTDAATIPCDVPYLSADPGLTEQWRNELAAIDGFKIGIAWQGSRDYRFDRWRSIPLADFAPLAALPGVRLISLQKGFGSEQIAAVDFPLLDFSGRLDEVAGPFMDTAAVISNLDLVVTANTAIAHLAGALGAPVFLALQFSPDWRWLLGRDDSPWYPTMRLFRQTVFGRWPDVFQRIAAAVQALQSERG